MREAIRNFANAMEAVLVRNDWKQGWQECSVDYLFNCLILELAELHEAIYRQDWDLADKTFVQDECTDIANFAMMIWDVCDETE